MRCIIALLLFLQVSIGVEAKPSELNKKVQKEVSKLFDTEVQIRVLAHVKLEPEGLLKEGDLVWVIQGIEGILGYVISTSAKGRYDYFDYSVIFSQDLTVLGVLVTTYRSSHGAGICSKGWLKQFKGYAGEEIRLGREIDSVSGATISASSMLEDIKRCQRVLMQLRSTGIIS